jgi:probable HAF family extracellular repeat protein
MNTRAIRSAQLVSALGLSLSLASGAALAQATYRLIDLGTLGGNSSYGFAINVSGQVTGTARTVDGVEHPFLWDGTTMQGLGALDGTYGNAYAINDSGEVTGEQGLAGRAAHAFLWDGTTLQRLTLGGSSGTGIDINAAGQVTGQASVTGGARAFLWDGTTTQDLGTLADGTISVGLAINASAQVTGWSYTAGERVPHAFLWNGTTLRDLGTLGGMFSEGYAINDSGWVTGQAHTTANVASHAFLWDGTTMQDLGTLGGLSSRAFAINNSGQVTGEARTSTGAQHPFLWDGMTMRDLTLGGSPGFGNAINASGQVTGWSYTAGNAAQHAFLWDGTTTHDLNALIDTADPLQPHVTLVEGRDINARGQIVANGIDSRTGEQHAYLVSPAEAVISLAIEKRARLTEQGAVVLTVQIVCGPSAGVEDFQETSAGADQERTGAKAEGGIDGTVVCDGVERTHTAHLSSFTEVGFKRGPAGADVSLSVCTLVGDDQTCFTGAAQRRVIIKGGVVP